MGLLLDQRRFLDSLYRFQTMCELITLIIDRLWELLPDANQAMYLLANERLRARSLKPGLRMPRL
ncbi:MAG: hypothetical protein EBY17_03045 [Acidobacteriia bacterium]|nr:hypothetical protein [Terriglobia bacterium]